MTDASGGEAGGSLRIERSPTAPAGWDELVAADGSSDYAHTAHWTECAVRALPDAGAVWLSVRRDGRLVAGLSAVARATGSGPARRRRLDSSLEGTSGGPLVAADLPESAQRDLATSLLRAYRRLRPGALGAVTLALGPAREARFGPLLSAAGGWTRQDSPTAVIDLQGGLEFVERHRLSDNKRNERNRGLRRGATVNVSRDPADLAAYYPLYLAASAQWGVEPAPLSFLQALLADPRDRVFFTCARVDDRVAGGHLNLHLGDRVFAWNGVTDPSCARTHFPATLCLWGDLQEACRRGARWLDIGASGGISSLESFKRAFGAEVQPRGYYVDEGPALRAGRAVRAWLGRARAARAGRDGGRRRWHDGRDGEPRGRDGA